MSVVGNVWECATMELGLSGSVVAVFGSASGIGAAIARAFSAEGARIAAIDLDPRVIALAGELAGSIGLVADVCDYAAVRAVAGKIYDALGPCEHVVYAVARARASLGFRSGISSLRTGSACSR